jgi:hypothetical protein
METKGIFLDGHTDEAKGKIVEFFSAAGITPIFVDSAADAVVTIHWPTERVECDENNLYADGFSTCQTAFKIAGKLGIERGLFGEFVNLLSIKLKQCQFGCF